MNRFVNTTALVFFCEARFFKTAAWRATMSPCGLFGCFERRFLLSTFYIPKVVVFWSRVLMSPDRLDQVARLHMAWVCSWKR